MQIQQVVVTEKEQVFLQNLELNTKSLADDELIIETEVTFISAGTELANYTAADKNVYIPGSWCAYPWKSGYANVGTVRESGAKGQHLIGRRIYTIGPHASAFRYQPDLTHNLVFPVPDDLSSEEAVAARMGMISLAALNASKPVYSRTVVIFGLGMVGNVAAQLFRLTGAVVIGIDPSATRRRMATECGIPHVLAGTEEELAEKVGKLTGGKMADVAIDAVGHSSVALQALRVTGTGGEVIVLGTPRGDVPGNLSEVFVAAHMRWITIKGCLEWNVITDSPVVTDYTQAKKLASLYQWIADGRLRLRPMITHVLPPEKIKQAYDGLLGQKEDYVGVVLRWKESDGKLKSP